MFLGLRLFLQKVRKITEKKKEDKKREKLYVEKGKSYEKVLSIHMYYFEYI